MDELSPANITETALSGAYEKILAMVEGFGALLPKLAIALVLLGVFYLLGRVMEFAVSRVFGRKGRENLGEILGGLVKAGILLSGFLIAATVVLPSVKPVDILGGLGLGSVAIGFAFKDILQNWLSGLLILIRQPFEIGDWIEVDGALGTVERIETRATMIKTFDGKLIVVPNSDIYTDKVTVWTHYPRSKVIRAIKRALDDAGIDMPFETQVHLIHDQTEATDGDRTRQREGWPAGDNPPKPANRAGAGSNGSTVPG